MSDESVVVLKVYKCGVCGADHEEVRFIPLHNMRLIEGLAPTHWGVCPQLGDPLFMEFNNPRLDFAASFDKEDKDAV